MKLKVLVITGYYLPGVKGGGPIQSIKNMVDHLSDRIEFYIVTSDRDFGDSSPYKSITSNEWNRVGKANVLYLNRSNLSLSKLKVILNSVEYDVLYLNSFFSYKYSIFPIILKRLKNINSKTIILAPRGEFSPGAILLNKIKKNIYIKIVNKMGLYLDVKWHATAKVEQEHIKKHFGSNANITTISNLTIDSSKIEYKRIVDKFPGELKIIFLSRIHPKKNLISALKYMLKVEGKVDFNIYGPIEDKLYWKKCMDIIQTMPDNINVSYKGIVSREGIISKFRSHHIFLFPTLGENYGHVISESLLGGCPVIVSDQTPWRDLESRRMGWDINLKNEDRFVSVIQECLDMDFEKYKIYSQNAFSYGKKVSNPSDDILKYIDLFTKK